MEVLKIRYLEITKALKRLDYALNCLERDRGRDEHDLVRDSVIQRFEFCTDTLWKFLKAYLEEEIKIQLAVISPRKIFRFAADQKLITDDAFEVCMRIIEDRNMTSHTYHEELARNISERIPSYYQTMQAVIARFEKKL